jgi:tRNA nucleotidyltransferase/poly(A) polymerase
MSTLSLQKQELAEIDERIKAARASLQSFNETQKAAKEQNAFESIKKSLENLEGVDFSKYGIDLNEIKSIEDLEKALQKVTTVVNKNAVAAGEQFA